MTKISADQIGLRDAAEVFGVSIDTLRRRIRDNQLDEALLVQGPFGATWVLPRNALAEIAAREEWEMADVSREASETESTPPPVVRSDPPVIRSEPSDEATAPGGTEADVGTSDDPSEVIDLRRAGLREAVGAHGAPPVHVAGSPPGSVRTAAPEVRSEQQDLVRQIQVAVAGELHTALTENVEAELTRVRDAITSAEVRAVAAEARTDAIRSEQGRLQAQLKRAEADVEYWRSQHDRLDKELDRERTGRVSAERSKAIAETQASEVKSVSAELRASLADALDRERALVRQEAALSAELDQAVVAMGWWSRRKLARLQARTGGRTQPPPAAD
ncbi:MAG: hypothetical protein HKN03_08560 [Acidimicrobiales bacterium]|nr:hypothetical protein [Acidimicrobiales bacterium]